MAIMDFLGGAAGGAATGGMLGGPWGAAAGGVIGGGLGLLQGQARSRGANAQRASTDAAMRRLQMLSQQQYAQRMQDVEKAMSFYGPARNALMAYGEPTPQLWGPHGPPPPPLGAGTDSSQVTRMRRGPFEQG